MCVHAQVYVCACISVGVCMCTSVRVHMYPLHALCISVPWPLWTVNLVTLGQILSLQSFLFLSFISGYITSGFGFPHHHHPPWLHAEAAELQITGKHTELQGMCKHNMVSQSAFPSVSVLSPHTLNCTLVCGTTLCMAALSEGSTHSVLCPLGEGSRPHPTPAFYSPSNPWSPSPA